MGRTLASLLVRLEGDDSDLQRVYDRAQKASTDFASFANRAGTAVLAIGTAAIAAGNKLLTMSGTAEQTQVSFEVFTKSAEKARKLLSDLNQDSIPSPFRPEQYQAAAKTLLGFGDSLANVRNSLRNLGEAAAATGARDLSGLSLVYGQIIAQQRAFTQDLNQFVNQGIPIFDLLADVMDAPKSQLKELAAQGKITADIVEQAFERAASSGGRFEGAMLKQSKTLNGLVSILEGNLNLRLRDLGDRLLPGAKIAAEELNKQVDVLGAEIQRLDESGTLDQLSAGFVALASSIDIMVRNVIAATGPIRGLVNIFQGEFKSALDNFAAPFENLGNLTGDLDRISEKYHETLKALSKTTDVIGAGTGRYAGFISEATDKVSQLDNAAKKLKLTLSDLPEFDFGGVKILGDGLSSAFIQAQKLQKLLSTGVLSDSDIARRFGPNLDARAAQASPEDARALLGDSLSPDAPEIVGNLTNKIETLRNITSGFGEAFGQAFSQIPNLIGSAIVGAKSFGEAWRNVGRGLKSIFQQLIKDLIAVLIKTLLISAVTKLLGNPTGGFGKSFLDQLKGGGGGGGFGLGAGIGAISGLIGAGSFRNQPIEVFGNLRGNDLFVSNRRTASLYNRIGG